jgi:hypothetical protein
MQERTGARSKAPVRFVKLPRDRDWCRQKITASCDPVERSIGIGELSGIQDLDTGIMLAIERSHRAGTTQFDDVRRVVEPDADVIHLNRISDGILSGVWDSIGIAERIGRRRSDALGDHEGFNAEPADELGMAHTELIGLNVSLVPSHPKRLVGYLNHKDIEAGMRRQAPDCDFHDFDGTHGFDFHSAVRIGV